MSRTDSGRQKREEQLPPAHRDDVFFSEDHLNRVGITRAEVEWAMRRGFLPVTSRLVSGAPLFRASHVSRVWSRWLDERAKRRRARKVVGA